jgi:hypothetical protein
MNTAMASSLNPQRCSFIDCLQPVICLACEKIEHWRDANESTTFDGAALALKLQPLQFWFRLNAIVFLL